jgi:Mg-chelatase subunit ChlD
MNTFRTAPAASFVTPSKEEIERATERINLESFDVKLIQDFANLAAGGNSCLPSHFRQKVGNEARANVPPPDSDGEWRLASGDYTKKRDTYIRDRVNTQMSYHSRVSEFMRSVNTELVPGETPLEKGINFARVLARLPEAELLSDPIDGNIFGVFSRDDGCRRAALRLNRIFKKAQELDRDAADLLDPENNHPSTLGDEERIKLAEEMAEGKDVILEISQKLKTLKKLKAKRPRRLAPDVEGDNSQHRQIRSMNEIGRLVTSEWANAPLYRRYRIATKSAQVRERTSSAIFKQLLYLLLDVSGSMDSGQRVYKMSGVVMNRLQAVLDDQAELFVRMFDVSLHKKRFHITNREEAQELMSWLQRCKYDGKKTDIDLALDGAVEDITQLLTENPKLERPEIAIVTDGDDTVCTTVKDLGRNTLHSFVVECENEKLGRLAVTSGGVALQNI